jgi:hypothetical protein
MRSAHRCALVLGDNIFFGQSFGKKLEDVVARPQGATVFGYQVMDPERIGRWLHRELQIDAEMAAVAQQTLESRQIFSGSNHQSFGKKLEDVVARPQGATVFGYQVMDPERFGVVEPMINAWARPSGDGCTANCRLTPKWLPSPSKRWNPARSWFPSASCNLRRIEAAVTGL